MELILDTADLDEIKKLGAMLSVDGVTTNPTIIAQSGKTFDEVRIYPFFHVKTFSKS